MSPRRRYELSRQAAADLDDLLQYTAARWGEAQSERYATDLAAGIERITEFPDIGRPRREYPGDVRSYVVKQHSIFYREGEALIRILRIAHVRQRDVLPDDDL